LDPIPPPQVAAAAAVASASAAPAARPSRLRRLLRRFDAVFLLTVFVPTLLAAAYYGAFASDVYVSESRFVVRNPQRPSQTGLGALLQGTVLSRAQDDTYSVHDFMLSRDALLELDRTLGVREAFGSAEIDVLSRFPGWHEWGDRSFESLHRYYQGRIEVAYDTVSSITTLRVRAFDADGAQRINESLLSMGERLVNTLNLRSRQDLIQVAESEVRVAEERSKTATAALAAFRADRSVFDPTAQSALQLQGVVRLREELLAAEQQLAQVRQVSPNNPQVGVLQTRVESLRQAVAAENARVLGREGGLAAKSPAFDRLTLEKTFADRQLASALSTLDSARSEAARKQLYLERLVQPNRPDSAVEPRRLRAVLTVFVVGLLAWGVVSLVLSSVREHTD
jgi:capsular polysaccharide transport system permease protein